MTVTEWMKNMVYLYVDICVLILLPHSCLHLSPFVIKDTLFIKDTVLMVWGSFIYLSFLYKGFIKCKALTIHMCPISICSFFHWPCHVVSLIIYELLLFVLSDESHYHPWLVCCTHHTVPNLNQFLFYIFYFSVLPDVRTLALKVCFLILERNSIYIACNMHTSLLVHVLNFWSVCKKPSYPVL